MIRYARFAVVVVLLTPAAGGADEEGRIAARVEVEASAATSVVVLTRADLEASGARDLGGALVGVAGLYVSPTNGSSGAFPYLRGGDPNFTLVLVDGVALNDETEAQGGAFDLSSLAISTIDRVEIEKGARSSSSGSRALGGVIRVYSRDGGVAAHDVAAGLGGAAHRWASGTLAIGSGTVGSGATDLRATAAFVGVDYERVRGRIGDDRSERGEAVARVTVALGDTTRLALGGRYGVRDVDDYPEASGGPGAGSGTRQSDTSGGSARAALHVDDALGLDHELAVSGSWSHQDRDSPGVAPLVPASREDARFHRVTGSWSGSLVSGSRVLRMSLDARREVGRVRSELVADGFAFTGDYDLARGSGGVSIELLGAPVAGSSPEAPPAWSYELGARFDVAEGYRPRLNPRASLGRSFGRDGRTRLFAAVARGFKLPSFFALASPAALGGNPELEPERGLGFDLGVEQHFVSGVSLGATAFTTRYDDLIDFDFATFRHVNRGRVRARGVELTAGAPLVARLSLQSSLSLYTTRDRDTDEPLLRRPSGTASVAVAYRPRDGASFRLEGRWVSSLRDRELTIPDRDRVDGHVTLDASARWPFSSGGRVDLRVSNLADSGYETLVGFPGAGRAVDVGVGLEF